MKKLIYNIQMPLKKVCLSLIFSPISCKINYSPENIGIFLPKSFEETNGRFLQCKIPNLDNYVESMEQELEKNPEVALTNLAYIISNKLPDGVAIESIYLTIENNSIVGRVFFSENNYFASHYISMVHVPLSNIEQVKQIVSSHTEPFSMFCGGHMDASTHAANIGLHMHLICPEKTLRNTLSDNGYLITHYEPNSFCNSLVHTIHVKNGCFSRDMSKFVEKKFPFAKDLELKREGSLLEASFPLQISNNLTNFITELPEITSYKDRITPQFNELNSYLTKNGFLENNTKVFYFMRTGTTCMAYIDRGRKYKKGKFYVVIDKSVNEDLVHTILDIINDEVLNSGGCNKKTFFDEEKLPCSIQLPAGIMVQKEFIPNSNGHADVLCTVKKIPLIKTITHVSIEGTSKIIPLSILYSQPGCAFNRSLAEKDKARIEEFTGYSVKMNVKEKKSVKISFIVQEQHWNICFWQKLFPNLKAVLFRSNQFFQLVWSTKSIYGGLKEKWFGPGFIKYEAPITMSTVLSDNNIINSLIINNHEKINTVAPFDIPYFLSIPSIVHMSFNTSISPFSGDHVVNVELSSDVLLRNLFPDLLNLMEYSWLYTTKAFLAIKETKQLSLNDVKNSFGTVWKNTKSIGKRFIKEHQDFQDSTISHGLWCKLEYIFKKSDNFNVSSEVLLPIFSAYKFLFSPIFSLCANWENKDASTKSRSLRFFFSPQFNESRKSNSDIINILLKCIPKAYHIADCITYLLGIWEKIVKWCIGGICYKQVNSWNLIGQRTTLNNDLFIAMSSMSKSFPGIMKETNIYFLSPKKTKEISSANFIANCSPGIFHKIIDGKILNIPFVCSAGVESKIVLLKTANGSTKLILTVGIVLRIQTPLGTIIIVLGKDLRESSSQLSSIKDFFHYNIQPNISWG